MKTSILQQNEIPFSEVELVPRLGASIPWPARRPAMAAAVFGWGRTTVALGLNELRPGLVCRNDLSQRRKPSTAEKFPQLVVARRASMDPESQAQAHLRTDCSYPNRTVPAGVDPV